MTLSPPGSTARRGRTLACVTGPDDVAAPARPPLDVRRLATDRAMSDAMWLAQVALPQLAPLKVAERKGEDISLPRGIVVH